MRVSKVIAAVSIALGGLLLAMQVIPVERANPTLGTELPAPTGIRSTLRRSCYDCHSNETNWAWYSRIAPFSWLVARDVTLGRRQLNFSEWDHYHPLTRKRKLQWLNRSLQQERMPPWGYALFHPGARLTPQQRSGLEQWVEAEIPRQVPEDPKSQVSQ